MYASFKNTTDKKVIIKPRINLQGLGKNIIQNNIQKIPFGFFVQEFIKGPHYSVDIRKNSTIIYKGRKIPNTTDFYLWHLVDKVKMPNQLPNFTENIEYWNFEMIGNKVIEIHLRPSVQFWSCPKYSLVIHNIHSDREGTMFKWKPKGIHDAFLTKLDDPTRRLIVNGDCLRTVYHYAMIIMS